MIIESNSIVEFIEPDLYITVLDPSVKDFKTSAQRLFERADAVVVPERREWKISANQRAFFIRPPEYVTPEIVAFVNDRLTNVQTAV